MAVTESASKKYLQQALTLLISAAVGALAASSVVRRIPRGIKLSRPEVGLLALAIVFGLWLVILTHELGHVLGGLWRGFRFVLLVVGPLKVARDDQSRIRLSWNRSFSLWGGLAACVPQDNREVPSRMAWMVAGGPLASVLLCAIGLLSGRFLPQPWSIAGSVVGMLSGAIAIATLLPLNMGSFYSDGARLLMLWRGGAAAERWCALLTLAGLSQNGVRPREYPVPLVDQVAAGRIDSTDALSGRLMRYYCMLDAGEPEAEQELEVILQHGHLWPDAFRAALWLEAAALYARRGEAAKARQYWEQIGPQAIVEPSTKAVAEAALVLAEGKREEAGPLLTEAAAKVSRVENVGFRLMLQDQLTELRQRLNPSQTTYSQVNQ